MPIVVRLLERSVWGKKNIYSRKFVTATNYYYFIIIIKTSLYTVANQLIYLQGFVAFH